MEFMPEGIYFGLPEEEYFADPSLSQSSMKWLLVSPMDYWMRSAFIAQVRDMGLKLGMSTTDMKCFEDHLTDMESDLFFDEQRDLEYSAENAGDVADQSYADYSRAFWESPA